MKRMVQINPGLSSQLDEKRGSGHYPQSWTIRSRTRTPRCANSSPLPAPCCAFCLSAALFTRSQPYRAGLCQAQGHLRKAQERSIEALWQRIGSILDIFKPIECANFFASLGAAMLDPDRRTSVRIPTLPLPTIPQTSRFARLLDVKEFAHAPHLP